MIGKKNTSLLSADNIAVSLPSHIAATRWMEVVALPLFARELCSVLGNPGI